MKDIMQDPAMLGLMAVASTGDIDGAMDVHSAISATDNAHKSAFPHECNLSDEQLTELGFKIGNSIDSYLRTVYLPEGWHLKHNGQMHNSLIDDQGRVRAWVMMDNRMWDRAAKSSFSTRYAVGEYQDEGNYDLTGACIIDRAGTKEIPGKQTYLKISEMHNRDWKNLPDEEIDVIDKFLNGKKAEYQAYIDEKFPDHKDVLAYWNMEGSKDA